MKRADVLRPFMLLAGVLAVLIAYYWVHKPFTPLLALALGGLALDVLTVAALVILSGGLGRALAGRWNHATTAEQIALESGLGLGAVALVVLVVGLVGLLNGLLLWGGLLVMGVVLRRRVRGWAVDAASLLRPALAPPTPWTRFLALFVWFVLLTALLVALAPPVAWDALAYHLVAPEIYLADGQITAQPDNFYLGLSQNVEMLYTVLISLFGRDTAAAPLHFWFGVMGLVALAGVVRRVTDVATGWLVLVIPLSGVSMWVLLGYPYVDLAVLAYAALVLVAVVRWRETRDSRWLWLAGVCVGLAMGVKYTAGILLFSVGLVALVRKAALRDLLLVGVLAGVVFLPWAVKGLLLYENPIYPFVFDGLNWSHTRTDFFNPPATGLIARGEAWQIPVLPLAATVYGVEKGAGYSFSTGLWLFTAPLLLLLTWGYLTDAMKRLTRDALLLGLPVLLLWMGTAAVYEVSMQTRLMTMLFPMSIVLGALGFYGLSQWPEKPVHVSFVVRGILVLTLVFGALDVLREVQRTEAVNLHISSRVDREAYLLNDVRVGAMVNAMRILDESVPPGSQIRFLWEPKGYYCPDDLTCHADELLDHWRYEIVQGRSPDAIFEAWREMGDDYFLVFESGRTFLADELAAQHPGMAAYEAARNTILTLLWEDGAGYQLYGWR